MLTHIRRTISEFIYSETGVVRQQAGLPMAWVVGTLVAMAVCLGTPDGAVAACTVGYTGVSCDTDPQCAMYCQIHKGCPGGICQLHDGFKQCLCCDPLPCAS